MQIGLLSLGDHLPDPNTGHKTTPAERHRLLVESAVRAEAAGFSHMCLGEHHFCDYILSAPPVVLAAIAERTKTLRLGTGVTLLANLDPVRVAEDYATVDALSDGRVELVMGRGILAHTYTCFGQELETSRDMYREKLELLLRLWTEEEIDWSGDYRAPLTRATAHPRPVQQPHPPIWVGGGSSNASVDLAARLGLDLMLPSVLAAPQVFQPFVDRYREGLEKAGHDPTQRRVGCVSHVWVAEDSQAAHRFWEPYYMGYLHWVIGLVSRLGASVGPLGGPSPPPITYENLLEGPAICGSPAEVADKLGKIREDMGIDLHLSMMDLGGMPEADVFRAIDLMGEKVLPAVTA